MTCAFFGGWACAQEGPSFNCANAKGWVEDLICGRPLLSALDRELATRYKMKMVEAAEFDARDKRVNAVKNLREGEREWLKDRALMCGGNAPLSELETSTCAGALQRGYETRVREFASVTPNWLAENKARTAKQVESLQLPVDWWGWTTRAHPGRRAHIFQLLTDANGSLFADESWRNSVDPDAGPSSYQFAIVNVVTGSVVASSEAEPRIWTDNAYMAAFYARLGLERIDLPLWGAENQNGLLRGVQQAQGECWHPEQYTLDYQINGQVVRSTVFYRKEDFKLDQPCADIDAKSVGFRPVWPAPIGTLGDGTFLVEADESILIRLTSNMSSDFLTHRHDFVAVPANDVDQILRAEQPWANRLRDLRDLITGAAGK